MDRTTFVVGAAIAAAAVALTFAGDLNPPAGAPAPTPGPEPRIAINTTNTPGDADSVFRIVQPGSYYLTGNVNGVAAESGIEIATHNVTIDLMGYTMQGVAASLDGIRTIGGAFNNLTVRNGVVTGFAGDGIDLNHGGIGLGSLVEQVHASGNTGRGISVNNNAVVRHCTAASNGGDGISAATNAVIESCAARSNSEFGISASNGSAVTACSAYANADDGIATGTGCTITACSAYDNTGDGISGSFGCTITASSARLNNLDGIHVLSLCTVRGNTCDANGTSGDGAGVHAGAIDNRIEGNHCSGNDRGIDVDGAGNIIIRNTCSGNTTNYTIVIGNSFGPLILAGTNAVAINGSAVAGTLGSTDPWANFSH